MILRRPGPRAILRAVVGGAVLALLTGAGLAQGLPPSDAARTLAEEAATAPAAPQATQAARPAAPVRRSALPQVRRIRGVEVVNPSAYLAAADLSRVAAAFRGRPATPQTLGRLKQQIDRLYAVRNIGLAQAVIEGVSANGTVRVRLFEARLGRVAYDAPGLSADYLRWRLNLKPGDLADTRLITARLERLAWTDGLQADARFAPGTQVGTTDLTLTYPPVRRWSGYASADNYVSRANGGARLSFGVTANALTGWNDPLSLSGSVSEGNRSLTLSYARAVTPGGDRLILTLHTERGDLSGPPRRQSAKDWATLTYSRPLHLSETRRLYFTAALDAYRESARLAGVTTSDQSGVALNLGVAGQQRAGRGVLGWTLGLTVGRYNDRVLGRSNIPGNRANGSFDYRTPLGQSAVFAVGGAFQYPLTTSLPAHDFFTVTAASTVPGYDEGISAGIAGYWVRAQIESARPVRGLGRGIDIRPYAFAAAGQAYGRAGSRLSGQGLAASVGVGLSGRIDKRTAFDLQVAAPLTRVLGSGGKGSVTISAALSVSF